jgi:protein TonB
MRRLLGPLSFPLAVIGSAAVHLSAAWLLLSERFEPPTAAPPRLGLASIRIEPTIGTQPRVQPSNTEPSETAAPAPDLMEPIRQILASMPALRLESLPPPDPQPPEPPKVEEPEKPPRPSEPVKGEPPNRAEETERSSEPVVPETLHVRPEPKSSPTPPLPPQKPKPDPPPPAPAREAPPEERKPDVVEPEPKRPTPPATAQQPKEENEPEAVATKPAPAYRRQEPGPIRRRDPEATQPGKTMASKSDRSDLPEADRASRPSPGSEGSEGAVDVLPSDRNNPAPVYPLDAHAAGLQGTVVLRVKLDATGKVISVEVDQSSGVESLDQAAKRAVERWRFQPAKRNGVPVAYEFRKRVEFSIRRR